MRDALTDAMRACPSPNNGAAGSVGVPTTP